MNVQAANCLLKTLEEPEPDVVLLLTAPDPRFAITHYPLTRAAGAHAVAYY